MSVADQKEFFNRRTGFSSNLSFADCGTAKSITLAGAHIRLGPADPGEGFPSGTFFRSPLLIANTNVQSLHFTRARVFQCRITQISDGHSILRSNRTSGDAIYFSVVTVTSLGYGDLRPIGVSKFIVSLEVLFGLLFWEFLWLGLRPIVCPIMFGGYLVLMLKGG